MTHSTPPLPSFVIIGASGCATRWLRFNLDRHPDIYAPPRFRRTRPAFLFDDDRLNGYELVVYRNQFAGWAGEPVVGAWEPECMLKQTRTALDLGTLIEPVQTARRMARAMPDARLVLMVRNPIDRIEVGFRRAVELGQLPPDADLAAMLNRFDPILVDLDLYATSMYTEAIIAFRGLFGDQLLVQFYDDVVADPASVYRTVLDHVGAAADFVPEGLDRVRYDPHDSAPFVRLSPEDRLAVYDFGYRIQVTELEMLTDRDLSAWDPSVGVGV